MKLSTPTLTLLSALAISTPVNADQDAKCQELIEALHAEKAEFLTNFIANPNTRKCEVEKKPTDKAYSQTEITCSSDNPSPDKPAHIIVSLDSDENDPAAKAIIINGTITDIMNRSLIDRETNLIQVKGKSEHCSDAQIVETLDLIRSDLVAAHLATDFKTLLGISIKAGTVQKREK